ncbi:hypothetical protein Q9L58_004029 [Maublancomyces gigas]|uniref:U1-type domain-containing protein n=1 Tax=Discina gigas TaxID=1032678 RepID=A0ABR3GMC1_9PEZI
MTYYPPDAIAWHCNICNTPVDVGLKIDHLVSSEHRRCAVMHPLGKLEDELTGRYVFGGLDGQDYDGGEGGVSVGGGGGEVGKVKGKQATVEDVGDYGEDGDGYEESESEGEEEEEEDDDEESEYSDEEEEDGEEYEEGEYEEGEYREAGEMLWTCEICSITINVFGRDDHIRSRAHLREARALVHPLPTPPPPVPTWYCAICEEEMTVFHQADHVASKQHLKNFRNQTPTHDPRPAIPITFSIPGHPHSLPPNHFPITPEVIKSTAYRFRNTFYCITCAAEFDLSTQDLHLDTTSTWDCTICPAKMHPAAREQHLRSTKHLTATAPSQFVPDLFYCTVCRHTYPLASRTEHLSGEWHRSLSAAQTPVTQMPLNPGARTWMRTTDAPMRMTPQPAIQDVCYVCKEPLYCELLSSHLLWDCTGASSSIAAPRSSHTAPPENHSTTPTAAPKPKPKAKGKFRKKKQSNIPEGSVYCYICHKHLPAIEMASHQTSKKHTKKAAKRAAKKAAKAMATTTATTAKNPKPKRKPKPKQMNIPNITAASAPYITVSGESFHCKVCSRNRMVAGMDGHVKSGKHRKNLAAVLAGQALGGTPASAIAPTPPASREGKLYCEPCKSYKTPAAMEQHCLSQKHMNNTATVRVANPLPQMQTQFP